MSSPPQCSRAARRSRRPASRTGIACALALVASGCATAPRAPALRPATGTVVVGDGAQLAYTTVSAAAPVSRPQTVVVLHGGPGATHAYLRPEWDRLATRGRVLYYDQRGCGASARAGPYTWETHVRDAGVLLDQLAPGERVVLAGSSWGSLLALAVAYADAPAQGGRGRVAALVLSGLPAWQGLAGLSAAQRDSLPDALVYGRPAIDTVPVAQRPPIQFPMRARGPGGAARTFTTCLGAAPSPRNQATMPPLAALRAITVPTLVVMGTDTVNLPGLLREQGAGVVATLPAAQRIVRAGTGHDPWLEQPDAFFAAVQRFLDEQTARSTRTPAAP